MNLTETRKKQAAKNIYRNIIACMCLCMLLFPSVLLAQEGIAVKGQVTDKDGPMTSDLVIVSDDA